MHLRSIVVLVLTSTFMACSAQEELEELSEEVSELVAVATLEAESMVVVSGSAAVSSDASASGGRVLAFYRVGAASGRATLSNAAGRLEVQARGDPCLGAPRLVVRVDGVQAMSIDVTSTSLASYSVPLGLAAGEHTFEVSFAEDAYRQGSCDRNLFVDRIRLEAASSGFEAESVVSSDKVFNDAQASGGRGAVLFTSNLVGTTLNLASSFSGLAIRARADLCEGSPKMVVRVDGVAAGEVDVSATSWTTYRLPTPLAAGARRIEVGFNNDHYRAGVCDRNLRLDRVDFLSCAPTTCAAAGATCGAISDGCGGTLSCGGCGTGQTCSANSCVGGGVTYFVDPAGSDSNSGTQESAAWRTLSKASGAWLNPGDRLLLKRGASFSGTLKVSRSGTSAAPIAVGAYGTGAQPLITGGGVTLAGSYLALRDLHVDQGSWAGIDVYGSHNLIERCTSSNNVTGIFVRTGANDNRVLRNEVRDNNRMSVNTVGGDDDSGAFGILLHGDRAEVAYNNISGSDAFSYDYGRDGAAVELYGAHGSHVHHNRAWNCDAFTELGKPGTSDNTFAYNTFSSANNNAIFIVTRGANVNWGPIYRTRLYNNTVYLTGASSAGFVCHAGCGPDILTMRNNVLMVTGKIGYADGPVDEDFSVFWGGAIQFTRGSNSIVANPNLVNPAAGDLRPSAGSPVIDRGASSGYSWDLDGASTPYDGNGDGTAVVDRGAYERH